MPQSLSSSTSPLRQPLILPMPVSSPSEHLLTNHFTNTVRAFAFPKQTTKTKQNKKENKKKKTKKKEEKQRETIQPSNRPSIRVNVTLVAYWAFHLLSFCFNVYRISIKHCDGLAVLVKVICMQPVLMSQSQSRLCVYLCVSRCMWECSNVYLCIFLCLFECMCLYVFVCEHEHSLLSMGECVCVLVRVGASNFHCVSLCAFDCLCVYVCVCSDICQKPFVHLLVCVYVCERVCVCIHL